MTAPSGAISSCSGYCRKRYPCATMTSDNSTFATHANGRWNRLVPLERTDTSFIQLTTQFQRGWKHPKKPMPRVYAIFKILTSEEYLKPFLKYRERIQGSKAVISQFKDPANEQLLFHGTNRSCLLGEDTDSSFDIKKCGTKNKFRRFGTGIYTTGCSSKADDYSVNGIENTKFRVLLLNRVIVGKPLKRRQNDTSLTKPPSGYHSVVGEPGVDLNYEETVVYHNDAIRPAFLIVYGSASEVHSKIHALISALFNTPLAS